MIDALIAYYALGWVANGLEFVTEGYGSKLPFFVCMIFAPLSFLANIFIWIGKIPIPTSGPQYFWRKP